MPPWRTRRSSRERIAVSSAFEAEHESASLPPVCRDTKDRLRDTLAWASARQATLLRRARTFEVAEDDARSARPSALFFRAIRLVVVPLMLPRRRRRRRRPRCGCSAYPGARPPCGAAMITAAPGLVRYENSRGLSLLPKSSPKKKKREASSFGEIRDGVSSIWRRWGGEESRSVSRYKHGFNRITGPPQRVSTRSLAPLVWTTAPAASPRDKAEASRWPCRPRSGSCRAPSWRS